MIIGISVVVLQMTELKRKDTHTLTIIQVSLVKVLLFDGDFGTLFLTGWAPGLGGHLDRKSVV